MTMNIFRFLMLLVSLPMMVSFNHHVFLQNNRSSISKPLRMSLSNNYLTSLKIEKPKDISSLYGKLPDANETTCDNLEITGVVFNIYKLKNIFFSKRSSSIMFNLRENMKNIYFLNNTDIQKVSEKTKVTSQYPTPL